MSNNNDNLLELDIEDITNDLKVIDKPQYVNDPKINNLFGKDGKDAN